MWTCYLTLSIRSWDIKQASGKDTIDVVLMLYLGLQYPWHESWVPQFPYTAVPLWLSLTSWPTIWFLGGLWGLYFLSPTVGLVPHTSQKLLILSTVLYTTCWSYCIFTRSQTLLRPSVIIVGPSTSVAVIVSNLRSTHPHPYHPPPWPIPHKQLQI